MSPMTLENPLAWVHLRLRGGWKTLVTSSLAYTGIIVGAILLSVRADPPSASRILYFWTQGLLGLQAGVLVLFAGTAIRNAVRRDFTTHMIESHRLMPITGAQAVLGYIVGPATQFLAVASANLLIGSITSGLGGLALQDWLFANFILGIFAFSLWFAAVLSGFVSQGGFPVILVLLGVSWFSQGALLAVMPGLAVLCGPLIGKSVFGIVERGGTWNWALQVSTLAQLAAAGFCFLGAARKYRRDDLLAFEPKMGLLLLVGWLVLCVIAIRHPGEFRFAFLFTPGADQATQTIGTVLTAMLLGILPVSSAVWLRAQWVARRIRRDVALGRVPIPPELVAISAAAFIGLFGLSIRNPMWPYVAMTTAGVALAFMLSITYLLGIMYRVTSRVTLIIVLFTLLTWAVPFGIDGLRFGFHADFNAPMMTWISTLSPIGAMSAATDVGEIQPLPGVMLQFIPAVVLGLFYYRRPVKLSAT